MTYYQYIQQNIDKFKHLAVNTDHCIARVVLDDYCKCKWSEKLRKPAIRYLTQTQHNLLIAKLNYWIVAPKEFETANKKSLEYRRKKVENNVTLFS